MNLKIIQFKEWLLNEVDWEKFQDVSKVCISPDELASKLNDELERLKIPAHKRPRFKKGVFPQIASKNIPLLPILSEPDRSREKDDLGEIPAEIDIERFKSDITGIPKTIFDVGEKSKHTNELDEVVFTVNTGIPALRTVIWDEDNKKFYVLNTCPGAGACAQNCYALKGFYIMNKGKNLKLTQRINMLVNHPKEYESRMLKELRKFAFEAELDNKKLKIRWNDAGDFFSDVYFDIAVNVTNELKKLHGKHIESYAYTKSGKYIALGEKHGLTMNFSMEGKPSEREGVNLKKTKLSIIVPKDVFKGIFERKTKEQSTDQFVDFESGREELKKRIWEKYKDQYKIDLNSLKYTDEIISKAEGKKYKYNVIVLPHGDSDISAQRRDVRISFLLEH
jgi:hypothetical protein